VVFFFLYSSSSSSSSLSISFRLGLDKGLAEFALHPDTVHLQLPNPVDDEPPINNVFLDNKTGRLQEVLDFLLGKEVDTGTISPHVKVVSKHVAVLESQLREVVPPVIPKEEESPRLQRAVDPGESLAEP